MSDGDDTTDESEAGGGEDLPAATLEERLDAAADDLEAAETEGDLDDVEAELDAIEADLPEPTEDEDGEEDDPAAEERERLGDLRDQLAEQRGPYAEDVTEVLDEAETTIEESEWTETGESEVGDAVETVLDAAGDELGESYAVDGEGLDAAASTVATVRADVDGADLDADDDAETIASLLEAAETLAEDLEAAEVWSDLTVRQQLDAQGFYDVLSPENRKDYPPEWSAIKIYAEQGEPEPILTALEKYESDFMEENILDAIERFAPEAAFDAVHQRAQRRDTHTIRILGRIGDERACDTLVDFLGGGDVELEKVTLRALGAIGDQETTQAVANRLDADDGEIRSTAARSLGMLGDTRAVDPLSDVLHDDEADEVRASAAWALRQIGTEDALDTVTDYAGDRSYIVQAEAKKAAGD